MPNSTKQICMKHFDISDKGASIRCGNTAKAEKDQRSWIQVCGSLIKDKLRLASSASSSVLKQRFEFGFGAGGSEHRSFPARAAGEVCRARSATTICRQPAAQRHSRPQQRSHKARSTVLHHCPGSFLNSCSPLTFPTYLLAPSSRNDDLSSLACLHMLFI